MYECGLHTKFRSEELKGVSALFRYGAASLGVKAEKFVLKQEVARDIRRV